MLILTEDAEITGLFETNMHGYNVGTDPYVKHCKNLGLMKSSNTLQKKLVMTVFEPQKMEFLTCPTDLTDF